MLILDSLFSPQELLFCGTREQAGILGQTVRPVRNWRRHLELGISLPESILPNPIKPEGGKTQDGRQSFRADNSVKWHRFVVTESDTLDLEVQLCLYFALPFPISAIIYSGGKSYHAWIDSRVLGEHLPAVAWKQKVENQIKPLLIQLGADPVTFHAARLTRTPGHYRSAEQRFQRLVYLNPNAASFSNGGICL